MNGICLLEIHSEGAQGFVGKYTVSEQILRFNVSYHNYYLQNMEPVKQKYEQIKFISQKPSPSPVENLVLMLHAVNLSCGLTCISEQSTIVLPKDWHHHQQGVYSFIYKLPSNKKVQFRFVDNNDGNLSVNFVLEDSETLNQISLKVADDVMANGEKYLKYLKEKIDGKKQATEQKGDYNPRPLEPVPLRIGGGLGYQPMRPAPISPDPFPGGGLYNPSNEYVGPDSGVFRGSGGIIGPYSQERPPNLPYGARYDPTSPFDLRGPLPEPGSSEPVGFDDFGRPIMRIRPGVGNLNPRKPPGGFGGFGGDLGGRGFF